MAPYLVPDPPANLADVAKEQRLTFRTRLFRCHSRNLDPDQFNPGFGTGGRFHFFVDALGKTVPVLYAGDSEECAVYEAVLRDVPLAPGTKFFAGRHLRDTDLSSLRLRIRSNLRLVEFHDPGLLRLGLRPQKITATTSHHYPRTLAWARAVHDQVHWAQGMVWMSARANARKSLILFGDRVDSDDLVSKRKRRALDDESGWKFVKQIGARSQIEVSRPSWL